MTIIRDFKILREATPEILERKVVELLNECYYPHGPVFLYEDLWTQAMYKHVAVKRKD